MIDKTELIYLLSAAAVDNTSKFVHVDVKLSKSVNVHLNISIWSYKKRKNCIKLYIKFYLKQLLTHFLQRVLDWHTSMAFLRPTKPHWLSVIILSASGTYNYNPTKWLEEKLKPLSINEYTITDAFIFADEIRTVSVIEDDMLVSYDMISLFTSMPQSETINILVEKAFTDDWFNTTFGLNLQKYKFGKLLKIATTSQLSSLMVNCTNRLMANVFMCHLEEKLSCKGLMPDLYKRYVEDALAKTPSIEAAFAIYTTLNGLNPSMKFIMELPVSYKIRVTGTEIVKSGTKFQIQAYRKPTNIGLLLHFRSHTDKCYEHSLLKTMLHFA